MIQRQWWNRGVLSLGHVAERALILRAHATLQGFDNTRQVCISDMIRGAISSCIADGMGKTHPVALVPEAQLTAPRVRSRGAWQLM